MAVVPASHTFAVAVATTSEANTFIRDPIAFLLNRPVAHLRQIVAQSLANGVATPLTFTAETVDTDVDGIGGHDNVTNPSRYTARYPGWYQVSGGVQWASNATGSRLAGVMVNGTVIDSGEIASAASAGVGPATRTILVFLSVGDYVELYAYQDSGVALNTVVTGGKQPNMTVVWMRN